MINELTQELSDLFKKNINRQIALEQSAYMRNQFPFLGIKKPERTKIQKPLFKQYRIENETVLSEILKQLWEFDEREFQYAACDLTDMYKPLYSPKMLKTFEATIINKSWWDTVDRIASNFVGTLITTFPPSKDKMYEWIRDDNMWIRRSALLFQLRYKEKTDEETLFEFCRKTCHEKDFFMRKAIGWVLREYAKTNKVAVRDFIKKNSKNLSSLTIREASKYL